MKPLRAAQGETGKVKAKQVKAELVQTEPDGSVLDNPASDDPTLDKLPSDGAALDSPALDDAASTPPIAFFDGNCGLCTGLVRLLDAAERGGRVRFEPLQGELALRVLEPRHLAQDTLWLKQGTRLYARSSAVLRLMWLSGWPWRFAAVLLLVPRPLRDRVYEAIARRRR